MDSDWSQGILVRTFSDSGQLKLDYNFGIGKDGSYSGSFESNAPAWRVSGPANIATGTTSVTLLSAPSGLSAGDEALLINLQGTPTDTTYVGNYELLEVASISGNTVIFRTGTRKSYGTASTQAIFLQRVPHYTTAIVNQMTTSAWNPGSSKTGVIAFRANTQLTINSYISVNGLGYPGGGASIQGTSISGSGVQSSTQNTGGGGGGANYLTYTCGGGGGGHITAGTNGGQYLTLCSPGLGGSAYNLPILGSGGGGGGGSSGGSGGSGGGTVIIFAKSITGSGYITAKGSDGTSGASGGGGGSGGSVTVAVSLQSTTFPTSQINVSGGLGGSGNIFGRLGGLGGSGYLLTGTNEERFLDGRFVSKVFDGAAAFPLGVNWTNVTVSLQMPASSQVKVYYHVCSLYDCSDKQNVWTECGTFTSAPGSVLRCDTIPNTNIGRYFQYRLDIERPSGDVYATPSVSSIKIEYKSSDTVPPLVTMSAPSGWVNTDQMATIACTDSGTYATGCDGQSYAFLTYSESPPTSCPLDYSQYQPTSPVSNQMQITSRMWVCGVAKDMAGNPGFTLAPVSFQIDKSPPAADVMNESTSWIKSNTLIFSCTDALSGCQQGIYYSFVPSPGSACQSGGTLTTAGSITVSSDHNDYVCIRASDNAANVVTAMSSQLFVDTTSPVTTDNVLTSWYGNPANIKLICFDSMSGCSSTYYCIDSQDGTCTPSIRSTSTQTSVDVTCVGQQTCSKIIRYYSEDAAGNREATKTSAIIKIDTTLPVCTITSPVSAYTTAGQITVSWQATSPGSPIANVTVEKMEGLGSWEQLTVSQSATGNQIISNPINGVAYSFRCKAANQMGIESSYSSVATTTVDTTPPTASITATPVVNSTVFLVSWLGEDPETGISNYTVFFRVGSTQYSQWQVFQSSTISALFGQNGLPVTPQNGNTYTFKVSVMDKAGNTKESSEISVLVDTAKPTCTVQDMPAQQSSSDFTVSWSGADGESGVKEYMVEQRAGTGLWTQLYTGTQTSKDILSAPDGTYRFRCKAMDNANNMGDLSAEKSTIVDVNPPESQANFSSVVFVDQSLVINARITDSIMVTNVTLYYNDAVVPEISAIPNSNYSVWDVTWTISGFVTTGMETFIISVEDANWNSRNYTSQFLVAWCTPGDVQAGCICGTGTKTCMSDGTWSNCTGVTKQPLPEVCNGEDDDCNLIVDDIYGSNSIQSAQCQCYGTSLLAAQSEICDGIDNDCDGQIDEIGGCCDEGNTQPCGSDVGVCSNKRKICTNQIWGPCEWENGPNPGGEICGNNLDDDCDGQTDENCASCTDSDGDGYGYMASNLCAYPGEDCNDYDSNVNPGMQEVCDGIDNDCDLDIDEGLECETCSNGIQDMNEEGVDCGGDCLPCFVWGWLFLTAGGIVILIILAFVWLHMKRQGREFTWEELKKKWSRSE